MMLILTIILPKIKLYEITDTFWYYNFNFISNKRCSGIDICHLQKGVQTKQQIATSFALPLIRNGAKYYHIKYTSKDARGNKDTLSGLMVVPDDLKFEYQIGISAWHF